MALEQWPVSLGQEFLLVHNEFATRTSLPQQHGHFPIGLEMQGCFDLPAIQGALNQVVRRHAALRTAFAPAAEYSGSLRDMLLRFFCHTRLWLPGLYRQVVSLDVPLPIALRIVGRVDASDGNTAFLVAAEEEATAPLPADEAPQMRASVISNGADKHLLVITISHLIADAWSARVLRQELVKLYTAARRGEECVLPPVALHYPAFAAWEHQRLQAGELAPHAYYWRGHIDRCAGAVIRHQEIPFARTADAGPSSSPPPIRMERLLIEPEASLRIRPLGAAQRITPYLFFRATVAVALHHYTRKRQVAFWANFANRRHPATEHMIGSCANPHLVPVDFSADPTFREVCQQLSDSLRAAQAHEALSLPALWHLLGRTPDPASTRITFDYAPPPRRDDGLFPVTVPGGRQWKDLDLRVHEEGATFALVATYNASRYQPEGVAAMLTDLRSLASALPQAMDTPVSACARFLTL